MNSDRADERKAPVLVLFRNDLRLADNRALAAAAATGRPIATAFVLDDQSPGVRPRGAARRWWLDRSLRALSGSIARRGGRLVLRRGAMVDAVDRLVAETGADTVLWNRRYDPAEAAVDAGLKVALRQRDLSADSFDGHLLHEPTQVRTATGGPYRVFTPFWRALVSGPDPRAPADAPHSLSILDADLPSDDIDGWKLLPTAPDWAGGMRAAWTPGEAGAHQRLAAFLEAAIDGYGTARDVPGGETTSRLSPHLAHGEITPFQIFSAMRGRDLPGAPRDADVFRKEVGWREFAYHLLFHNPALATENFNRRFDAFPWREDAAALKAWQRGQTGYPIVDAGMRELWATGWMHNRVRMVVASFLAKHLRIDWRAGERWFWDTLVDADPASNPASWQWVAGSGADAAPYFRIFNPVLQGEKFDPDGAYVRRHVPELARLPDRWLHRPWEAPGTVLSDAGVKLGQTYPVPLVDHGQSRDAALSAYETTRGAS